MIIVSIIVDFSRSRALGRIAKKYNSQALEADALHFSTDIWSSVVVLIGLLCTKLGFNYGDPIAALGVAIIVLVVCYRLGKKAVDVLLDKAPAEMNYIVKHTLNNFPEIKNYHSLKIRTSGADTFIKVNIHLEPALSLQDVHNICDKIEHKLEEIIPRCEVYLHAEPQSDSHINHEVSDGL